MHKAGQFLNGSMGSLLIHCSERLIRFVCEMEAYSKSMLEKDLDKSEMKCNFFEAEIHWVCNIGGVLTKLMFGVVSCTCKMYLSSTYYIALRKLFFCCTWLWWYRGHTD